MQNGIQTTQGAFHQYLHSREWRPNTERPNTYVIKVHLCVDRTSVASNFWGFLKQPVLCKWFLDLFALFDRQQPEMTYFLLRRLKKKREKKNFGTEMSTSGWRPSLKKPLASASCYLIWVLVWIGESSMWVVFAMHWGRLHVVTAVSQLRRSESWFVMTGFKWPTGR